jgi:hypothetical protein
LIIQRESQKAAAKTCLSSEINHELKQIIFVESDYKVHRKGEYVGSHFTAVWRGGFHMLDYFLQESNVLLRDQQ